MALMTYVREYFARVKVFVDILTGKEPATYEKGGIDTRAIFKQPLVASLIILI